MKPTRGRIVDYHRAVSREDHLETWPAVIVKAELKAPREDLDGNKVPWNEDEERSYNIRLHVFGNVDDSKHDAQFYTAPKAGHWSWPERIEPKKSAKSGDAGGDASA